MHGVKRTKAHPGKPGNLDRVRRNLALVRAGRGQPAGQEPATGRLAGVQRAIGLLRDLAGADGQATARQKTNRAGLDWRTCQRLIAMLEDASLAEATPAKRAARDNGVIFQLVLVELLSELVDLLQEKEATQ